MITLDISLNTIIIDLIVVEAYFHLIFTLWMIKKDDSIDIRFINIACTSFTTYSDNNLNNPSLC